MGVTLAQITDLHISSQSDCHVKRLQKAVDFINQQKDISAVLVTGDLVDDGTDLQSYEILRQNLENLTPPYYLIGGNHDLLPPLQEVFFDHAYLKGGEVPGNYIVENKDLPFVLVGLNTVIEEKSHGQIVKEQLVFLEKIHNQNSKPIVVMMHHPPFSAKDLQGKFGDKIQLHPNIWDAFDFRGIELWNAQAPLWTKIKLIVSGHFHLGFKADWKGQNCVVSPSIAPPFGVLVDQAQQLASCGVFITTQPGVTLHHWHSDLLQFETVFLSA